VSSGGLRLMDSASYVVDGCLFASNYAGSGGAMRLDVSKKMVSNGTVSNCTFRNNEVSRAWRDEAI